MLLMREIFEKFCERLIFGVRAECSWIANVFSIVKTFWMILLTTTDPKMNNGLISKVIMILRTQRRQNIIINKVQWYNRCSFEGRRFIEAYAMRWYSSNLSSEMPTVLSRHMVRPDKESTWISDTECPRTIDNNDCNETVTTCCQIKRWCPCSDATR